MRLVYIAGPYTAPTRCAVAANVQRAREVADRVARAGAFPVCPHLLGSGIEDADPLHRPGALCCYCTDATRCHRTVLASVLARLGATYKGEA